MRGPRGLVGSVVRRIRRTRLQRLEAGERPGQAAAVFDYIYRTRVWGQGREPFYSGAGSDEALAAPYLDALAAFIGEQGIRSVADLGCGDFRIGARIAPMVDRYVGVDAAPSLVSWLQRRHAVPGHIEFQGADISRDALPAADLYLARQVLQHLSNTHIIGFLRNLPAAGWLVVTEHHPLEADLTEANLDKRTGHTIRTRKGSGVFLDRPPFSLGGWRSVLLEEPADAVPGNPPGLIRTYLFDLSRKDEAA
jgi:SAM-dependent methyltransferase